ncbi:FAD-binding oxidoreductase [Ornithobacterium rhinotracheale]|uniref:NAD(P)/FAD-dependent oxidoreductase n=1 Tax=Ornithobacterium rhinotracheale TaxID=28251 RepID=UPI00129C78A5|nr:FAD-dependent oxidoreductase [Ornithobacterium rhinotracheale]MRJ07797.1 FAD-binding oxidoreductase [Ornithobacterium rhinotracheale]UOH78686.1 FAD-dependent oxidoreductase [Ornithobacterium rhinotracheale]
MKTQYLLVGYGIANVCFAKYCVENKHSFIIFDDQKITASNVAAGVVNPIVLKRFTPVWQAIEQMDLLKKTFGEFTELLGNKYFHEMPIYRVLANDKEAEIWHRKIQENTILEKYLAPKIIDNKYESLKAEHGFGTMKETGYVDITQLLADFKNQYKEHFRNEKFDYAKLDVENNTYEDIIFDKIVFAEGSKVSANPYFNFIPVVPNKGQVLKIRTEESLPRAIVKSKCFLMPIGKHEYYVGATYNREFENDEATIEDREKLEEQLAHFYTKRFQIIDEKVGIRPTVPDHKPIIGQHPEYSNLYVLNGLGTRGTFNGPAMSKALYESIEQDKPIDPLIDIKRFL